MKRITLIFFLLWAVLIAADCQNVASLVITLADGTTTSYELFTRPRVTFINDSVKIVSPTVSAEYLATDVLRFNYRVASTAIEKTTASNGFSCNGEYLVIGGNVSVDAVKLFTANGMELPVKFSAAGGTLRLRVTSLQRGVYLVDINGKTFKFMKL